jgi:hypothetical protein
MYTARIRVGFAGVVPALVGLCWVGGCSRPPEGGDASSHIGPVAVYAGRGPVSAFTDSCTRCHIDFGATYADHFYTLSDTELRKVTEEMMRGPAMMRPTDDEVAAMVAFQQALRDRDVYLCVTDVQREENGSLALRGEGRPGTEVTIYDAGLVNGGDSAVVDENGLWETRLAGGATASHLRITAKLTGKERAWRLDLNRAP